MAAVVVVVAVAVTAVTLTIAPPAAAQRSDLAAEVTLDLRATSGDVVELWHVDTNVSEFDVGLVASAIDPGAEIDSLLSSSETDHFDVGETIFAERLPRPTSRPSTYRHEFDTSTLDSVMLALGVDRYLLTVCWPDVAAHVRAASGGGGSFRHEGCLRFERPTDAAPTVVTIDLTVRERQYTKLALAVAAAAGVATYGAILCVLGLRRRWLRTAGRALGVGAAGVVAAYVTGFVVASALAIDNGPVTSFVIGRDLDAGHHFVLTMLPGVLATIPATVFAAFAFASPVLAATVPAPTPHAPQSPYAPYAGPGLGGGPGLPTWLDRS